MAKKNSRLGDEVVETRSPILTRNAILWSAFFLLFVASIVTVMIPELADDGAEDEADATGAAESEEGASDEEPSTGRSGSPSPTSSAPAAP